MSNLYKISSVKRNNGSINDFTIQFSTPLPEGMYKLRQSVIPNSVFVINSTNNKIYFQENGGNVLTATLVNGNYDITTLTTLISSSMTSISSISGLSQVYTAVFNTTTNIYTINVSSGSFKLLMETYTNNSSSVIIGFKTDNLNFSSSQIGNDVVNLTNNLYSFNLNIQSQNINNYLIDNRGVSYSFSIPVTSSFGNVCVYEPLVSYYIKLDTSTRLFKIQVRDDNNNLVQLNSDYYFILELI